MPIHVKLRHLTLYKYDRRVALSPQIVRLRPAAHARTPIEAYSVKVEPKPHFANWQQDPYGNHLLRLVFPEKTDEFRVEVELRASMIAINPFDFFLEPDAQKLPFAYDAAALVDLAPYLRQTASGPLFDALLADLRKLRGDTVPTLMRINGLLQKRIGYLIRMEPGVQGPEETLTKASGSCRDSAWLLVQLLRGMGMAARFVSGYLVQLTPDVKPLEGPEGPKADFLDLHAWAEVYLPGAGWVGFDPTSGLAAGEGHIPLAATPEPLSAAPITGAVDKSEVKFHHEMTVERINEAPRVTKPYTDEAWSAIEALGHRLDAELRRHDMRLTMGGEPTFVSIDDMDGAEWNTEAVGADKLRLSHALFRRLRERFGPAGLAHFGQGKWYPGESLPRWALSCYWRRDGQPIWTHDELIGEAGRDYGHTPADAQAFVRQVAERLALDPDRALPAYEDLAWLLAAEARAPINVDLLAADLDDDEERRRLARLLRRGVKQPAGYVLPVSKGLVGWGSEWMTGRWLLRQDELFLIPGDSPMGLRLPIESLPMPAAGELVPPFALDPTAARAELPPYERLREQLLRRLGDVEKAGVAAAAREGRTGKAGRGAAGGPGAGAPPQLQEPQRLADAAPDAERTAAPPATVRTALCVEPRGGMLRVFLPPVRRLEDYLELVTAVEQTAVDLDAPVQIEGYTPPEDFRIRHFKITPDPGVIEVNIQPAADWEELVATTTGVYEEAHQVRLGTEKFMLDGRHTGTGGGNHITLGGPSPADSPFLRRPDLLRSIVGYWNNHPSLSFLFSGLFVGPTSQAPRLDEARLDALREIDIAFAEMERQGPNCPPWLVDRLLRHLLVDATGNTHRAEFCIDKLFSPDTSAGRLGIVEMRSFEMPPHARMSLTQQLLLRTLAARFWEEPYREPLVRWGTRLHDQFMLPHFVWRDFEDVIRETNRAGFELRDEWFVPHFEFRFPVLGALEARDVDLTVRRAIEPWHVLGEEPGGGGTARYVDSSLERLEVRADGIVEGRHTIACNGRPLPLRPTGTQGQYVAGVRFRAWQPPSCLHPTIGVHAPLVFDIVDRWNECSLGGCTYHVAHPGGRHYETFPVNAAEAESRRIARFFAHGHTQGRVDVAAPRADPEFPYTLDLRR